MKHGTRVKAVFIYFWLSPFVPDEWLNKQTTEIVLWRLIPSLTLRTFFSPRIPTANLVACQIEFLKPSGPSNSVTKRHLFLHSVLVLSTVEHNYLVVYVCYLLHKYQLHVSALMAIFRLNKLTKNA